MASPALQTVLSASGAIEMSGHHRNLIRTDMLIIRHYVDWGFVQLSDIDLHIHERMKLGQKFGCQWSFEKPWSIIQQYLLLRISYCFVQQFGHDP